MDPAPAKIELAPGTVIAQTYRIERRLGEGGMGIVFEAQHLRVPRRVAVKVLREQADTDLLGRFRQEAEVTSRLRHEGIVDVIDFNTLPSGTAYIVMELLEGESLAARMHDRGALASDEVLPIIRQIAAALHAAHCAGVVHRDLKPENVFLSPRERNGVLSDHVKILDFGISKVHGSSIVRTRDNVVLGTPRYMAPEQALGRNDELDPRCDQFSLAVIAYEMLTGTVPFTATNSAQVMYQIAYEPQPPLASRAVNAPAGVIQAVERAMSKQPSDRFVDLSAFMEALTGRRLAETDRSSYPVLSTARLPASPGGGPAPVADTDRNVAATVPSKPKQRLPDAASAETESETATVADRPSRRALPEPRRSRWPLVVAAIGLGAAATTVVLVMNNNNTSTSAPAVASAPIDASAAPIDASAPVIEATSPPDAGADASIPVDAALSASAIDAGVTPKTQNIRMTPEAADALKDAEDALMALDLGEAERAARRVLRIGKFPRAYEILVEIECARHDLPAVHAWLRNLPPSSWPRMHARCRKNGFESTDPP